MFFSINGIRDVAGNARRVSALLSLIGSDTYRILRDLCTPDLPKDKKYEDICKLLKTHFCPMTSVYKERIKFFEASQEENENVNAWFARIHNLSNNCEFGANLKCYLKDKFVCSMKKGTIRDRLCEEKLDTNLDRLLELALLKETSITGSSSAASVNLLNNKIVGNIRRSSNTNNSRIMSDTVQETVIPVKNTSPVAAASGSVYANKISPRDVTKAISEAERKLICSKYTNIANDPSTSLEADNVQSQWTKVEHKRPREKQRGNLSVGNFSGRASVEGIEKSLDLHVYNLKPNTTVEELKNFLVPTFSGLKCEPLQPRYPDSVKVVERAKTALQGSPQTQSIAKITIESINLKVPHLTPNDDIKLQLLTRIKAYESMMIPFRRWELHELPALTQESTIEIWSIKTCSALDSPRYVIVFFQTKKADNLHEDVTLFDNANIKSIRLALNSDYYPQERMLLDFSKDQYADAHFNYTEFNKSYHNCQEKRSLVTVDMNTLILQTTHQKAQKQITCRANGLKLNIRDLGKNKGGIFQLVTPLDEHQLKASKKAWTSTFIA
ncbi:unnamed protein product [Phaedon cochleariae]|uniref:Double jelly roll-like domain-containing protein n=1 Tax=Phaedon cochleariae TaxID=80249 RepID=A0A9N9SGN6_PHACE|nr:unnamed protein product [Phaedon cochleariae]